jgi:hypothetical protein
MNVSRYEYKIVIKFTDKDDFFDWWSHAKPKYIADIKDKRTILYAIGDILILTIKTYEISSDKNENKM